MLSSDYPKNWDEIRRAVLERDRYKCCNNPTHVSQELHVHHVVPITRGGTHQLSNLITLCDDCHKKVHPHLNEDETNETGVDHLEIDFADIDISTNFVIRDFVFNQFSQRLTTSAIEIREPLKDFRPLADEFQQKVIDASNNTIRVLAPAGSGKTQTIINRVIRQIERGVKPTRILILTFDNSAVNSIREKMRGQFSEFDIEISSPEVKTLNAFGFSILRTCFPEEFKNIILDNRPRRLFKEVKKELGKKRKDIFDSLPQNIYDNFYLDFFSLLKNEIIDPRKPNNQQIVDLMLTRNEANPFFPNPKNRNLVEKVIKGVIWLYMAYEKVLQRENYMDFDDQKLRPYILLEDNPIVLMNLQGGYDEIIVDEFQDINKLDFELIKRLAERSRLVVAGDDDQAIYGFRGCSPEYILNLENKLGRPVKTYKLPINYRSPKNIVEYSTRLIRHNTRREEKEPIANKNSAAKIKIVSSGSAGLEAKLVVEYLKKVRLENPGLSFNNFAVLYRTNAQSLPLQIEFILNDIPYYVREEDNILKNDSLNKLLGFLRMKISITSGDNPNPQDVILAVKAYFRYINIVQESQLLDLFSRKSYSNQLFKSEDFYQVLEKARQSRFSESLQIALDAKTLMDTLDGLSKFNGLRGMIGSIEDVLSEKVPLGEIFDIAANFRGNTKEFVAIIQQAIEKARSIDAGKDKDAGVGLLTYFRSKGLQWHTVVLTTCNEGLIPHERANIEDERRLFYVAMTRAESNLLLSYVNNACGNSVNPSRFLQEAGLMNQ